jgi:glutamyl-tRNA synthetase
VLLKSDGFPTYHLANVVDDRLMRISHVIRGEEWLSSLPKHLLLYQRFGWEPPVFCHLPLLRNPDRSKLSKRKNPTSIHYYRRAGFLPEALGNYLALMGWSMPDGRDKFTLEEMVPHFRLEDVALGGPVFDIVKLRWLNGRYLREDLSTERLVEELKRWGLDDERLRRIAPLVQPRLEVLSDWGYLTAFFFSDQVPLDPRELKLKDRSGEELAAAFQMAVWELEKLRRFEREEVQAVFEALAARLEIKLRDLTRPFYVAITGQAASTPLYDSMAILGGDLVRARLRRAIDALGGLGAKKLKEVERDYQARFGGMPD